MALPAPISSLANQAGRVARSAGQTAGLYAFLALVGLTGAGFLVAAAFIWLASLTNALTAALILAAAFLSVAGIWLAVLMARTRRLQRERRQTVANTALFASSISLADAGLRIASRVKGPMFWPAAATLLAAWYLTSRKSSSED